MYLVRSRGEARYTRTHGVHAEPITFGLKLALWYDEARRNLHRLAGAADQMRCGKISGVVGTFGHARPSRALRLGAGAHLRHARTGALMIHKASGTSTVHATPLANVG